MGDIRATIHKQIPLASALLVCLVHFTSFDVRDRPLVTDVRYYTYFAWQVTEGAVPHLDFFDNKTQLATFAGALFYALGEGLGADPLTAIRVGTLGLTALGGLLAFFVYRRLSGGRAVCGALGLLAYCGFGLLGVMAAIGNGPKLLMAVGATAAALLVHGRRWFWAGAVGALAFMDWQIGALVWIAGFVSALIFGRPRRRAALAVVGGGAAGIAPFVGFYAVRGALSATAAQVIGASLFRAEVVQSVSPGDRLDKLRLMTGIGCPEQEWLFYSSALGLGVVAWWLWRWRGRDELGLLLPLAIYHFGVVAFSFVDFQWYGDFYLLLHSAAFFLAVTWIALYSAVEKRVGRGDARVVPGALVAAAACLLAVTLARPGPLRPYIELKRTRTIPVGVTLTDQKQVAEAIRHRIDDRTIVFLEHSELLFLMRRTNALPVVYWNRAAWFHYRSSNRETFQQTSLRMVRSVDPDVVIYPYPRTRRLYQPELGRYAFVPIDYTPFLAGYEVEAFRSDSGLYGVSLGIR